MTKCGICDYRIEGDIYLIRITNEGERRKEKCKDCGRIHNASKNNSHKVKICGACYFDYEQKADELGYVTEEFNTPEELPIVVKANSIGAAEIHQERRPHKTITIRLLGKKGRKY